MSHKLDWIDEAIRSICENPNIPDCDSEEFLATTAKEIRTAIEVHLPDEVAALRADNADLERQLSEANQRIKELEKGSEPAIYMRDDNGGEGDWEQTSKDDPRGFPLYLIPPTANAAVAAALIQAEKVCEKLESMLLKLEEDTDDIEKSELHAAQASICSSINRSIRAIPRDTQALEEIKQKVGEQVARKVRSHYRRNYFEVTTTHPSDAEFLDIVQSVLKGE